MPKSLLTIWGLGATLRLNDKVYFYTMERFFKNAYEEKNTHNHHIKHENQIMQLKSL
jgi:hypothetical protein